jgi:hypothetical protein
MKTLTTWNCCNPPITTRPPLSSGGPFFNFICSLRRQPGNEVSPVGGADCVRFESRNDRRPYKARNPVTRALGYGATSPAANGFSIGIPPVPVPRRGVCRGAVPLLRNTDRRNVRSRSARGIPTTAIGTSLFSVGGTNRENRPYLCCTISRSLTSMASQSRQNPQVQAPLDASP